jgi:outer membrane protein, multidrug efflux system
MNNFLMSKFQLSILAAVLTVSGCTMIPKYERPVAPVAARFPGATESQKESAAADIAWQNFFAEKRLKKLIELALANNRDLRVSMLNVEQSRAQYRVTRSSSLPSVNGSGSFTRSHAADVTSDQWSASLGTTAYELDLFGRVRSLNKQALEKYFATEEAQRSAQITLVAEVASQYFTLRQAEEQLQLARQTLTTVQGSYDLNKATFDAGASNELDLRTAEGQVQTARINVLTYERQLAQAQNALVLLVGQPLPTDLPAPRSLSDTNLVTDIPAGLPSELVQRRPDILQAEHTLMAANANIGAARAAFFPSIKLTGSIGTTSDEFSKLFGAGTGVWSFSPQITVPIFTGGQNRADLDAAKVGARIEVANYEKAIQTAFREVADALVATGSYASQIEARAALINAQQRRFDLANTRYRQGEDSYLNVLSAQQDLYSAQQSQLEAQYNKLASQISLYKALGGGWK